MAEQRPVYYASGSDSSDRWVCQQQFVEMLRNYGFCNVEMHDPTKEKAMNAMDVAEKRYFALSPMAKQMMSVSAEQGYVAGNHKEMFHFNSKSGSVQEPKYWHTPTAPGWRFSHMVSLGEIIFNGINAHALGLLRSQPLEQEGLADNSNYNDWINAVRDSPEHVMTIVSFDETNTREFHTSACTDEGLLSIYTSLTSDESSPPELEVFIRGRGWEELFLPEGASTVICGDALEHATGGLFHACPYRIRNNGTCRWRVLKVRPDPSTMALCRPSSILSLVGTSLLESMRLRASFHGRDLMGLLEEADTSKSTSIGTPVPSLNLVEDMMQGSCLGSFDMLPSILVLNVFDWLRDLHDLMNLSLVSHKLHQIANSDVLCIPAAESSHIDWGAALDRIDIGAPSHARACDLERAPMVTSELLGSVSGHWISVLGSEMTDHHMRMMSAIIIVIVSSLDGIETFFKIRFSTRLEKAFQVISRHTGIELSVLRFHVKGRYIDGNATPCDLKLTNGARIMYVVAEDIEEDETDEE